jgi:hypothetical protein
MQEKIAVEKGVVALERRMPDSAIKSFPTSWGTTKPAFFAESISVNHHHWTVRISQSSLGH